MNPLNRRYSSFFLVVFTITVAEVRRAAVHGANFANSLSTTRTCTLLGPLVTNRVDRDKDTLQFSMLNYDSWDRLSRDGGGLGGPYLAVLVQGTFQMAARPGQLAHVTEPL